MEDTPPLPPPPAGGDGGGTPFDLFPYSPYARYESMRRLVNLAHGLPAGENEARPDYDTQLDAHKALCGYLKIATDHAAEERKLGELRRANDLKERAVRVQEKAERRKVREHALKVRAVEVQEGTLAAKREALALERERFEDARKTRKKTDSIADITIEAAERAEARKRERDAIRGPR